MEKMFFAWIDTEIKRSDFQNMDTTGRAQQLDLSWLNYWYPTL